jgi:hypothetical protein
MISQIEDVETLPRHTIGGCHESRNNNEMLPLMHPRDFLCEFPLTYGQLAQRLGVTIYAVDNWMGNRANPSRQTQRQLADFAERLKENAELRKSVLSTEAEE